MSNDDDNTSNIQSDLVTLTQLGKALKVSEPTVRHYITKGMPYVTEANRQKGIPWEFSLSECLEWFADQEEAKRAKKSSDPDEDAGIIAARIAKLNVETERLQLRLARERGELVPIDSVVEAVEGQMTTLRTHLLALPVKLAPILAGHTDIETIKNLLTSYIREALEELSEDRVQEEVKPDITGDEIHDGVHPLDEVLGITNNNESS